MVFPAVEVEVVFPVPFLEEAVAGVDHPVLLVEDSMAVDLQDHPEGPTGVHDQSCPALAARVAAVAVHRDLDQEARQVADRLARDREQVEEVPVVGDHPDLDLDRAEDRAMDLDRGLDLRLHHRHHLDCKHCRGMGNKPLIHRRKDIQAVSRDC